MFWWQWYLLGFVCYYTCRCVGFYGFYLFRLMFYYLFCGVVVVLHWSTSSLFMCCGFRCFVLLFYCSIIVSECGWLVNYGDIGCLFIVWCYIVIRIFYYFVFYILLFLCVFSRWWFLNFYIICMIYLVFVGLVLVFVIWIWWLWCYKFSVLCDTYILKFGVFIMLLFVCLDIISLVCFAGLAVKMVEIRDF